MALSRYNPNVGYGISNALQDLAPQPIVAQRDPSVADRAELGTIWVNKVADNYFVAVSVANNQTVWQQATGGAGVFTTLEVSGTVDIAGQTNAAAVFCSQMVVNGNSALNGGVTLGAAGAGLIAVDPRTLTTASITPTLGVNVGVITITGLTTGVAATQLITINNGLVLTTSGLFINIYNLNASGNNAAITIKSTVVQAGAILLTFVNNGSGPLGAGDNVVVSFWLIS